jgi:hypothetical protein
MAIRPVQPIGGSGGPSAPAGATAPSAAQATPLPQVTLPTQSAAVVHASQATLGLAPPVNQEDATRIANFHILGNKNQESGKILKSGSHDLIGAISDYLKSSPRLADYQSGKLSVYHLISNNLQFESGALKFFVNSVSKLIGKPGSGEC